MLCNANYVMPLPTFISNIIHEMKLLFISYACVFRRSYYDGLVLM